MPVPLLAVHHSPPAPSPHRIHPPPHPSTHTHTFACCCGVMCSEMAEAHSTSRPTASRMTSPPFPRYRRALSMAGTSPATSACRAADSSGSYGVAASAAAAAPALSAAARAGSSSATNTTAPWRTCGGGGCVCGGISVRRQGGRQATARVSVMGAREAASALLVGREGPSMCVHKVHSIPQHAPKGGMH